MPTPGDIVFGCFRLRETLGAGSFATAYLAEQLGTDRLAVVKIPHAHMLAGPNGPELQRRFAAEARASTRVVHPNLVTVYLVGDTQYGVPAIAMEYVRGETLGTRLARYAPLPVKEIIALGEQLAEVLSTLHEADIVHRDLSPSNVLVQVKTNGELGVKVLDLGVAKLLDAPGRTMGPMGTPGYIAPEQLLGAVSPRTDVFSLGALLWWAITGTERPDDISDGSLHRNLGATIGPDPRSIRPDAPAGFAALISRALTPEPKARPTMVEFLDLWRAAKLAWQAEERARVESMMGEPANTPFFPQPHSPTTASPWADSASPWAGSATLTNAELDRGQTDRGPGPREPHDLMSAGAVAVTATGLPRVAVVVPNPVIRAQVLHLLEGRAEVDELDARDLGRAAPETYAVAILGEQLPRVGTGEVIQNLRRCYPELPLIVVGYNDRRQQQWLAHGAELFVTVPYGLADLDVWFEGLERNATSLTDSDPQRTGGGQKLRASLVEVMSQTNPQQLARALEAFIGCVPQWIAEIEHGLIDPSVEQSRDACRQLIAGAETVGADGLARLARAACQSLHRNDPETARTFLAAAEREYREVFREAFALMNQLQTNG